jgi:hypothetical protein
MRTFIDAHPRVGMLIVGGLVGAMGGLDTIKGGGLKRKRVGMGSLGTR